MSKLKIIAIIFAFLAIGAAMKGYSLYQAISPNPISFWQASDEDNTSTIDHSLWKHILDKYLVTNPVSGITGFSYEKVSTKDKNILAQYLDSLSKIDPRDYQQSEQLAFWANLYNALTIDIVLKNLPIESIKDIGDGLTGPWNQELINIAGKKLTLNNIEHGILRGLWKDKRIHYVINCASIGCPDLPASPLIGENIETQLDQAATRFINQPKGVKFVGEQLVISSIFNWFSVDFGDTERALLFHLVRYAQPELKEKLTNFSGHINYEYNWKLNTPVSGH